MIRLALMRRESGWETAPGRIMAHQWRSPRVQSSVLTKSSLRLVTAEWGSVPGEGHAA
jgi:hypothetical protein